MPLKKSKTTQKPPATDRITITFEVPNLDCEVDHEVLEKLAPVFRSLESYCVMRAQATKLRKKGFVEQAAFYDGLCERIYDKLPKWARW